MTDEPDNAKAAALLGPRLVGDSELSNLLLTFWTTSATLPVDRVSRDPPNSQVPLPCGPLTIPTSVCATFYWPSPRARVSSQ